MHGSSSLMRSSMPRSSSISADMITHDHRLCSRRQVLAGASTGFGMLALRAMAGIPLHNRAKAKNIIFCFMDGGPSHVDTFDPKPMLKTHEGKAIGESAVTKRSQSNANRVWMGSPWEFRQRGQSGLWVSDLFPHIAQVADKLCVVKSMVGELPLHGQQNLFSLSQFMIQRHCCEERLAK